MAPTVGDQQSMSVFFRHRWLPIRPLDANGTPWNVLIDTNGKWGCAELGQGVISGAALIEIKTTSRHGDRHLLLSVIGKSGDYWPPGSLSFPTPDPRALHAGQANVDSIH